MVVAHEPIPYVLADPAYEADHSLYPVDSAYHRCCHSIGKHGLDCAEQGVTASVSSRDCDLMAPVPLPPGADSAGPWQLDDAGRPHRTTNSGLVQYANGSGDGDVRLLAYLRRGVVTLQFSDGGQPFQMSTSEAVALGEHLMVLASQAAAL
jgi:hypothetical protein